jgi:hypothetical protein
MKLGALILGTYRLIIIISFWCISPFISMQCPSLSHLIIVSLKSTLSKINVGTPPYFGGAIGLINLLPAFHPNQCLFLSMRWVSCKQQMVGSSFLFLFAKRCQIGICVSGSIDNYVVIPVI